jgi:hypothetical protein
MALPPGQYGAMHPMERIHGFTPAAAMLDKLLKQHKTPTKHNF